MRVLAVSGGERSLDSIRALLREAGFDSCPASSGAQARQKVLDEEWDVVVINYPLPDESGMALMRMIQQETSAEAVMLVRNEDAMLISGEAGSCGAITVEKPIVRPVFFQAVHLAASIKERLAVPEEKIRRLERQLEDARIESKAKCILSLRYSLSEEEGHRLITKKAMDERITLRQAAMAILREEA